MGGKMKKRYHDDSRMTRHACKHTSYENTRIHNPYENTIQSETVQSASTEYPTNPITIQRAILILVAKSMFLHVSKPQGPGSKIAVLVYISKPISSAYVAKKGFAQMGN